MVIKYLISFHASHIISTPDFSDERFSFNNSREKNLFNLDPSLNYLSANFHTIQHRFPFDPIHVIEREDANFRMDGPRLDRKGCVNLEILARIRSAPRWRTVCYFSGLAASRCTAAADLKNCILYSITRLSVRAASSYNSKRIPREETLLSYLSSLWRK